VEAALGPYAGAVVAESADAAVAALCWLKEKGETAILFAPLPGHGQDDPVGERMPSWERRLPPFRACNRLSQAACLADLVEADGPAAAVARSLLGSVVLCDTLPPPSDHPDEAESSGTQLW